MSAKSPIGRRTWQNANIYRAILMAYLFAMSLGASLFLAQSFGHFTRPDRIVIDAIGPPPVNYILPPTTLIAASALGACLLATDMHGQFTRAISYGILLEWSLVTVILGFAGLATYGDGFLREILGITYLPNFVVFAIAVVSNALMYVFTGKLYSNKSKPLSNIA